MEEMEVCGESKTPLSLHQVVVDNVGLLHWKTTCEESDRVRGQEEYGHF